MTAVLTIMAIYLTVYTFLYALQVWRQGNKAASLALMALMACFPALSIWVALHDH